MCIDFLKKKLGFKKEIRVIHGACRGQWNIKNCWSGCVGTTFENKEVAIHFARGVAKALNYKLIIE